MITGRFRVPPERQRAMIDRRRFIAAGASGLLLGGCDRLNNSPQFRGVLRSAEKLNMAAQRLVSPRDALAREYSEADMSPVFRSNGTSMPGTPEYARHLAENFANWRLTVDGLVARPLVDPSPRRSQSIPHRVQITRHDCVEGWSAIGKWHGARAVANPRRRRAEHAREIYRLPLRRPVRRQALL